MTCGKGNVPKVWDEIGAEDLQESELVDRYADGTKPEHDSNVGDDDLAALVRTEHH